jgi:hypothetical protein
LSSAAEDAMPSILFSNVSRSSLVCFTCSFSAASCRVYLRRQRRWNGMGWV